MFLLLSLIFSSLLSVFLFSLFSYLYFLFFFLFRCYSLSLSIVLCCSLLCTSMVFYTACRDKIYHFYPLIAFGLLCVSFLDCPLAFWLPSHHYYTMLAMPCPTLRQKLFCFVFYFPWHSHPDKGSASLLPTSIACI